MLNLLKENDFNILALDPAKSTGYCVLHIKDKKITIKEYNFIDIESNTDCEADRYIELMNKVKTLIEEKDISHVVVEDYFFNSRFATGSTLNIALRTSIHIQCKYMNIPYTIVNIAKWKKFIAGSSMPNKEQKRKYKKDANKFFIKEALEKKFNIVFPDFSESKKTGKNIKFRFDIVDAVAQAIYFCHEYLNLSYNV